MTRRSTNNAPAVLGGEFPQRNMTPWLCFFLLALLAIAASLSSPANFALGDRNENSEPPRQLWREGSRVELLGTFQGGGVESISFRPQKSDQRYRVLENLALQRVAKVLAVNKRRLWQVTAEVTEFENTNYLLLRRVVAKSKLNEAAPNSQAAVSQ